MIITSLLFHLNISTDFKSNPWVGDLTIIFDTKYSKFM